MIRNIKLQFKKNTEIYLIMTIKKKIKFLLKYSLKYMSLYTI